MNSNLLIRLSLRSACTFSFTYERYNVYEYVYVLPLSLPWSWLSKSRILVVLDTIAWQFYCNSSSLGRNQYLCPFMQVKSAKSYQKRRSWNATCPKNVKLSGGAVLESNYRWGITSTRIISITELLKATTRLFEVGVWCLHPSLYFRWVICFMRTTEQVGISNYKYLYCYLKFSCLNAQPVSTISVVYYRTRALCSCQFLEFWKFELNSSFTLSRLNNMIQRNFKFIALKFSIYAIKECFKLNLQFSITDSF